MLDANFRECPKGEVHRISIPRTPVNKGNEGGTCTTLEGEIDALALGEASSYNGYRTSTIFVSVVSEKMAALRGR
jgi:hypothetical protein